MTSGQGDNFFAPADAERFCGHCGFPFRPTAPRNQRHCFEYPSPGHGRCGQRHRDAQTDDGLRRRLNKTQGQDPRSPRTSEDAIAHAWVRQNRPNFDLRPWQSRRIKGRDTAAGNDLSLTARPTQAFLLGWHPESFHWENEGYYEAIEATTSGRKVPDYWTVGGRRGGITPGDRAFVWRYQNHRGLVASGTFTSGVYSDQHWDGSGRLAYYADVEWDTIVPYEDCLPIDQLIAEVPEMRWGHLQGSGLEVKPEAAVKLSDLWERHIGENAFHSPDEPRPIGAEEFPEGALSRIEVNRYERDPRARRACLQYWGYHCAVCDFSFEDRYGPLGRNYIHVHHIMELSRVPDGYQVNPIQDLRPLCPNCHAMIHRDPGPAMSIEELKGRLRPGR